LHTVLSRILSLLIKYHSNEQNRMDIFDHFVDEQFWFCFCHIFSTRVQNFELIDLNMKLPIFNIKVTYHQTTFK